MMGLADALCNGRLVVVAECTPTRDSDPSPLVSCAAALAGSVDALCVPESEDGPRMSSLAACAHLLSAKAEPVFYLATRDLNRIALQSAILGAASLGLKNILCLSGRHQALISSLPSRSSTSTGSMSG